MATYPQTAQGFDEPCHVAAGIELLAKGTYTLDPVHPPLSRIAIALPLYLFGERYPHLAANDPGAHNYNVVGNAILYSDGHYLRNLELARCGVLPFFVLAVLAVFFWARSEFGNFAGAMAIFLLTTTPIILAFSGLAYTDIVAASTQTLCLFAFVKWIEQRSTKTTCWLGVSAGLAFLAKLTSFLFLPPAALAISIPHFIASRGKSRASGSHWAWMRDCALAGCLASAVLWAGYGFSVGHVREDMQLSVSSMPSFQHFPRPVGSLARRLITKDSVVPAPALLRGVADAWVLNQGPHESYLLGRTKNGGWWYFFLVGICVKTPLPFLILTLTGVWSMFVQPSRISWQKIAPVLAAVAILIVTMPVRYDAGMRHVLVLWPLLAITAGAGCTFLWQRRNRWVGTFRVVLVLLLVWQAGETMRASGDYIAYFNELVGQNPSRVLLTGCDLDCGQDLFRLAAQLRGRRIAEVKIAMWSSADLTRMGLPRPEVLQPFRPSNGWIAISMRSLLLGHVFHEVYPPGAFDWLRQYRPVAEIGKTVLLYYIPDSRR